jgi:hypothetical protein
MRRRSAGSVITVAIVGGSATAPRLRWKLKCGSAVRLSSQARGGGPGPAEVDGILESIEDGLDPSGCSGAAAGRGDVDRALLEGRGAVDGERSADLVTQLRFQASEADDPGDDRERALSSGAARW